MKNFAMAFLIGCALFMLSGCTLHTSLTDRGITFSVLKNSKVF